MPVLCRTQHQILWNNVLASKVHKVKEKQWSIPPVAREDLRNLICLFRGQPSILPACFESGVKHIWTYRSGTVIKETRKLLALSRAQSRINLSRCWRGERSKSIFDPCPCNLDNQYAVVQQESWWQNCSKSDQFKITFSLFVPLNEFYWNTVWITFVLCLKTLIP